MKVRFKQEVDSPTEVILLLLNGPCNCVQASLGGGREAASEFLLLEVAQMRASREGLIVVR